jgi:hypothetical protein
MKSSRRIWPKIFLKKKGTGKVTVGSMKKSHKNGGYKKPSNFQCSFIAWIMLMG